MHKTTPYTSMGKRKGTASGVLLEQPARKKKKKKKSRKTTYLCGVHLVLADDLDGDVTGVHACPIPRTVDVAESTVAHLFDELPAFQARVVRELAAAFALLGDNLGNLLIPDAARLGACLGGWLANAIRILLGMGMSGCLVCCHGARSAAGVGDGVVGCALLGRGGGSRAQLLWW